MFVLALASLIQSAWASVSFIGPDHAEVDLLRVEPDGPRIYVRATYPDGTRGLFLVDTGANVSLLSRRAVERLGLDVDENYGSIIGLGGVSRMDRAVLPSLQLGPTLVPDVEVGVGVAGMVEHAGAMPLDGLLGNNVWSRFTLEIDYPADLMVLHRPGTLRTGRRATPMVFDGSHVFTPIEVRTTVDPKTVHSVVLRVDTGASELSLCGLVAQGLGASWSEGLEPVRGLGSSGDLPAFRDLQPTRRLELAGVRLGGRRLDHVDSARWMSFGSDGGCPDGLRGLAGHALLAGSRVLFDFEAGRLELKKSRRRTRSNDGHRLMLAEEEARGRAPERALYRARLALQLDDLELAREELGIASETAGDRVEALVFLARLDRYEGDSDGAIQRLLTLSPGELVDHGELVATVNGLVFAGRQEEALALAERAIASRPEGGWPHVAMADLLLATGDAHGARQSIGIAVSKASHPDTHLLRRARIALALGDRDASTAHVRRLLRLYPMGGEFLWFYALLAEQMADRDTFQTDIERAMARLHPHRRPFDFLVVAEERLGGEVEPLLEAGLERDCEPLPRGPARDNCFAWYWSLSGTHPDEALRRVERALEGEARSDYLDTLAMVHLARGELDEAAAAARRAAVLAPDSVYLLWQAERLRALVD